LKISIKKFLFLSFYNFLSLFVPKKERINMSDKRKGKIKEFIPLQHYKSRCKNKKLRGTRYIWRCRTAKRVNIRTALRM